jgi:GntR family transcriptional regulator
MDWAPFQFRLNERSGVPLYRQLIDQVMAAIASGTLVEGDQLPTVRQAAVDLSINLNTVVRAYREMEIRGILSTQQGSGTYISGKKIERTEQERQQRLAALAGEMLAQAASEGFTLADLLTHLQTLSQVTRKGK